MEQTIAMEGGGTLYLREEGTSYYLQASRPQEGDGLYKIVLQGLRGKQVLGTLTPQGQALTLTRMVTRNTLEQWGCYPIQKVLCQLTFPFQREEKPAFLQRTPPIFPEQPQNLEESPPEPHKIFPESPPQPEENIPKSAKQTSDFPLTQPDAPLPGFAPCLHPGDWVKIPGLVPVLEGLPTLWIEENSPGFTLALPHRPGEKFPLPTLFCLGKLVEDEKKEKQYLCFSFDGQGRPCLPK